MGTPAELNQFLAQIEKRAYAMAMVSVGNPDDALDIVQDVMLTLARQYAKKPADQWRPLFYRMLKNRMTDHHRRQGARSRLFAWFPWQQDSDEGIDLADRAAGPDTQAPERSLLSGEIGEQVEQALRQLPQRQREAFMFRAWEGMDVRETAHAMGCSQGSVKTHYSRAVHHLRELLQGFKND